MKSFFLVLLALAGTAFGADDTSRISRGDLLKQHQYKTFANYTLFVDPTGSDSNACTASGVNACATPQGALNKLPKLLQHSATITSAAGNYPGFIISGFTSDPSVQQANTGISMLGTLANSTPATGTATGTATSGTVANGSTFGLIADTNQTWTVNDLRGRLLVTTGGTGSGQTKVISSNTSTVITIVGAWGTTPDATTTYAIQQPQNIITSTVTLPANAGAAAGSTSSIIIADNKLPLSSILIQNWDMTVTATNGVLVQDEGTQVFLTQVRQTANTGGSTRFNLIAGKVALTNCYSTTTSTSLNHILVSTAAVPQSVVPISITGCLFVAGGQLMQLLSGAGTIANSESVNTQTAAIKIRSGLTGLFTVTSCRFDCAGAGGFAIDNGLLSSTLTTSVPGSTVVAASIAINDCSTGFRAIGPGANFMFPTTGFAATSSSTTLTTGFDIRAGATAIINNAAVTLTSTTDVSLDNGAVTSTQAAVNASSCFGTLDFGSKFCKE